MRLTGICSIRRPTTGGPRKRFPSIALLQFFSSPPPSHPTLFLHPSPMILPLSPLFSSPYLPFLRFLLIFFYFSCPLIPEDEFRRRYTLQSSELDTVLGKNDLLKYLFKNLVRYSSENNFLLEH